MGRKKPIYTLRKYDINGDLVFLVFLWAFFSTFGNHCVPSIMDKREEKEKKKK